MTTPIYSLKKLDSPRSRNQLSCSFYFLLFLVLVQGNLLAQVLNVTQASVIEGFAGKVPNVTGASAVAVQGNYAYIVGTGDVLQILDITLPGLPVPKGNLYHGTGGASILRAQSIVVQGNYAYITSYGANALEIVDVSDPANPVHKGVIYDGKGSAPYLAGAWGLVVEGDYAYVTSSNSQALEIIDISNPSDPKHKGSLLDGGGSAPYLRYPISIFKSGDLAYIGNLGDANTGQFEIVDISNPSLPTHKGALVLGNNQALGQTSPYGIAVSGNYAYVTDYENGFLEVIDVSDPTAPIHTGMLADGGSNQTLPFGSGSPPYLLGAWDIHIAGNYAYISVNYFVADPNPAIGYSGVLEVVDISNPALPAHAGSAFIEPIVYARNMHIVGDKAYIPSRSESNVSIVSLSNPIAPKLIGTAQNGTGGALINAPSAVVVDGNYAYVGNRAEKIINGPAALEIINIADPTRPYHESSLDATTTGARLLGTSSIYKKGNFVYTVSDRLHSLQIIDVTVPSLPVSRGFLTSQPGVVPIIGAKSIVVDPLRTFAYVASGSYRNVNTGLTMQGSNAIAMVQLSNQEAPTLFGSLLDGGGSAPYLNDPSCVVQVGFDYLVVASRGSNALEVVQIDGPNSILEHAGSLLDGGGSAPYLNEPVSVAVQGRYAYVVSSGSKALEIVDILDPTTPVHVGSFLDGQQGVSLSGVNSVKVSGNYAYIVTNTYVVGTPNVESGALVVIDISNPAAPFHVDTFKDGDGGSLLDNPTSIFVSGPYAYITNAGLSQNLNVSYLFGPKITSVLPTSSPVGSSVTITGENFNTFLTATVNGTATTITNVTATTLTFTVPPGATNGKIGLTLNGQTISSTDNFLVTPTAAVATTVQQTSFTANWSDVGAADYFFDLSTDNFTTFVTGFSNQPVGNVTSLAIAGLNSGTSYQYRVRSSDGTLISSSSNTISFISIPQTPEATVATEFSASGFRVNWIAVPGASSYLLDVAYDETFTNPIVGYSNLTISGTNTSQLVSGLNAYTQCYYRLRSVSADGISPYSNVIEARTLDIINPSISLSATPNATIVTLGNTPILNTLIADNVEVSSAEIYYRGISESSFQKTALLGPGGTGGNYSVTVQSDWYDALGLEYYFKAYDKAGNETTGQVSYMQLITPSIALPTLPSGSGLGDYRIISFPFQLLPDNKVTTVYSGIPWNDNTKAAMWWWDPSAKDGKGAYNQYGTANSFQTIDPGKGYWAITSTSFAPQVANVLAPKFNRSNLYSMTLKPNWNEIGNPYPLPISWDDVIAFNLANGVTSISPLSIYDGTGYKNATGDLLLKPYEGGFVKNLSSSDITIQIPFPDQTFNGREETFSSDISQDKWNVFLYIDQNNLTNQLGGFGMHSDALSGQDRFDNFNPPSFLAMPSVNFRNQEFPSVNFSKEMVTSQEAHTWTFTPTGTPGQTAQLTWSPDVATASTEQLFLLDEEHLRVIDMLSVHHYDFTLTKSSRFKIYYGKNVQDKITTQQVVASVPYPNPLVTEDTPKINLSLPDTNDAYRVTLQLYDSRGDVIETVNKSLNSGIHQLEFASSSESLTSGIYVYKLAVTNQKTSTVYTGKIVKP